MLFVLRTVAAAKFRHMLWRDLGVQVVVPCFVLSHALMLYQGYTYQGYTWVKELDILCPMGKHVFYSISIPEHLLHMIKYSIDVTFFTPCGGDGGENGC